jgi:type I restriction enzyme, S subunit
VRLSRASYSLQNLGIGSLDPGWFRWITKTNDFWEQCDAKSRGTSGKNRIRPEQFLRIEIPLPPLPEQQRIVARIEELARRVEEARGLRGAAVGKAEALVDGAVLSVFATPSKTGWTELTLGAIVANVQYGTSEKADDDADGVPVLRMGNIQNGHLSLGDLKYVHLPEKEIQKLRLETGDVLVNRTNSAELVGKCAVFEERGEFVCASYIIRLRLNLSRAIPQLVASFINSPMGRQYMFNERKQMTGQANVNSQKLRALPLRLPDLNEQRRIVAYLDGLQAKVDDLRRLQAETQKELDALMPSMLAKAFAGEL